MDNNISISLDEVLEIASQIKSINRQLSDTLEDMRRKMNALEDVWQSESGATIRAKFNEMRPHFIEYENVVNSYAVYLEKTVEQYRITESNLNSNASQFR